MLFNAGNDIDNRENVLKALKIDSRCFLLLNISLTVICTVEIHKNVELPLCVTSRQKNNQTIVVYGFCKLNI